MTIAERIDRAMTERRLSNQAAADLLRVAGREAIRSWRNGDSEPDVGEAIALAGVLGVSQEWLVLGRDPALTPDETFVLEAYRAARSRGLSPPEAVMAIGVAADRDPRTQRPHEPPPTYGETSGQ